MRVVLHHEVENAPRVFFEQYRLQKREVQSTLQHKRSESRSRLYCLRVVPLADMIIMGMIAMGMAMVGMAIMWVIVSRLVEVDASEL